MSSSNSLTAEVRGDFSRITGHDIYLFKQGTHTRLYDKLGAHLVEADGERGASFAVWAPNARAVSVIADFNGWQPDRHALYARDDGSGIWEGFIAGVAPGSSYKYRIESRFGGYRVDKGDPFALSWECPPRTASRVWELDYAWEDAQWMRTRADANSLDRPMSVYELHIGSWRRRTTDNTSLGYRELAEELVQYLLETGFTHVELLPVMEHPFFGSWGYQCTGYFAPSSRYGEPGDFMYLVDRLHAAGIGVILDWVPSHFPADEHGLSFFDGTHLFEHADPRQGYHPEWSSSIFNYGRNEVRAFLLSSAHFWLERYHADGLRVDAVASMLYLDYARSAGEWIPNRHGGRENLEAVDFLRTLNESVYRDFPDVQTIAEESTSWPMVSRPVYLGGLGFGMKWNMGWMHDTLNYMSQDPVYRKYHHGKLTFSIMYAFFENFMLPLSHDEVVHGKRSLIGRMSGDDNTRFAGLRALYGYMYGHPGKKLLFMGDEFAQWSEWNHDAALSWELLQWAPHQGMRRWVSDLNQLYRTQPALFERDFDGGGFEWVIVDRAEESVFAFIRRGHAPAEEILVVCNLTPVQRVNYRVGVPRAGLWRELLNSDAGIYGGGNSGNYGQVEAAPLAADGRYHSLALVLPPMSVLMLKREGGPDGAE